MTERSILRRMLEEQHGVASYANDNFTTGAADFMPAGHNIELPYFDDDGVEETATLWCPPAQSTGTVQPTRRTKAHARGYVYDDRTDRQVGFSSTYELHCVRVLLANRLVAEIQDQPPAIPYVGADGTLSIRGPEMLRCGAPSNAGSGR